MSENLHELRLFCLEVRQLWIEITHVLGYLCDFGAKIGRYSLPNRLNKAHCAEQNTISRPGAIPLGPRTSATTRHTMADTSGTQIRAVRLRGHHAFFALVA